MTQDPFELDDRDAVAVVAYASETLNRSMSLPKEEVENSAIAYVAGLPGLKTALADFEQIPAASKGAVCREIIARGLLSEDEFVRSAMRAALLSRDRPGAQAIDPFSILALGAVVAVVLIVCKVEYSREKGWTVRTGPDPNKVVEALTELFKKLPSF
jgi:preprotein translocase subunit Sec61beta